jgi:hypothetical protein
MIRANSEVRPQQERAVTGAVTAKYWVVLWLVASVCGPAWGVEPASWSGAYRGNPASACQSAPSADAARRCACSAWNPSLPAYVCPGRWREVSINAFVRDDLNGAWVCTYPGSQLNVPGCSDPCTCHNIPVSASPNCPSGYTLRTVPGQFQNSPDKARSCEPISKPARVRKPALLP